MLVSSSITLLVQSALNVCMNRQSKLNIQNCCVVSTSYIRVLFMLGKIKPS
jgi:hypothetical protein